MSATTPPLSSGNAKSPVGRKPARTERFGATEKAEAAAALVRVSFLVQSIYSDIAATLNLTPAQAKLLCILKDAPRGMTELTQLLQLEKSSVSGLVDRTFQRELIERQTSTEDRRAVTIDLSPSGKRVAEAFYKEATQRLARLVEQLPAQDRRRFVRLSLQLVQSAAGD